MVLVKAFIPKEEEISLLEQLVEPITLYRKSELIAGQLDVLFLQGKNQQVLKLWVDYKDVAFKFECFVPVFEKLSGPLPEVVPMAVIDKWQSIKCCFYYMWQPPAVPGGATGGKRKQMSKTATSACVSMQGIAFIENNVPVLALTQDPNFTTTLSVLEDRASIEEFMSDCEVVNLADARVWCAKLAAG